MIDITKKMNGAALYTFARNIEEMSDQIGFKVSSRGWGYILEQNGLITKDQFSKVEELINRCRKEGLLPVDFVAEESSRKFEEVHKPSTDTLEGHISMWLNASLECHKYFEPDWWDGEEYYIQMVVEKIDLVTLFQPICKDYHIPIANSKGWSSILQRAEYCKRFQKAEDLGLKCVLLYCGDHDPDGLRISETLMKNLEDIKDVRWEDGTQGYDPSELIIDRFGLNYDFIIGNRLTWIDNLITGSGKNLASSSHPNYFMEYVQYYLKKVGERKCEANSLVIAPDSGRDLCIKAITKYLGKDAPKRFRVKKEKVKEDIQSVMDEVDVREAIETAIEKLDAR